jgi:Cupin superfamily protein
MLTFDTLFAPHEQSSLFRDVFGQSALYIPGVPGKFSELTSWRLLNHLLEFGGLSFPRLSLTRGGHQIAANAYLRAGSSGYQRPMARELSTELRNGATLTVESIEELHEPLSDLCQILECKLRIRVHADLYVSCRDGPKAPLRFNDHDVILLQIDGARDWQVFPMTGSQAPTQAPLRPVGEPAWRGRLSAQDLLYLPSGWWYGDEAAGEHWMCVALKFKRPTGLDVLDRWREALVMSGTLSRDVPLSADLEKQSLFLRHLQYEVTEAIEKPGLLLGFLHDLWDLTEPRRRFSLPWSGHEVPLPPGGDWALEPLLRFPHAGSLRHLEFEDAFEIIVDGRGVRFSEDVAKVVQLVLNTERADLDSILDACADVPRDRVVDCLIELVKSGAVRIAHPKISR